MTEVLSTTQAQSVRVTVRFHILNSARRQTLRCRWLPAWGVFRELMQLVDAPIFTVPLQASTAGGKAIPLSTMLEEHRCVMARYSSSSRSKKPAPVVRDAAEALAHNAAAGLPAQSATVWAGAGLLAASSIIAATLGMLPAALLVTLGAFILALWTRSALLTCLCIAAAAVAGWVFISPQKPNALGALGRVRRCAYCSGSLPRHQVRRDALEPCHIDHRIVVRDRRRKQPTARRAGRRPREAPRHRK